MQVQKNHSKVISKDKPIASKKPLNRQKSEKVIDAHPKSKSPQQNNRELDRDSEDSFPASDPITKY